MKKFIFGACAALMFAGVSCAKGGDSVDEKMPKALSDSISIYSGKTMGASVLGDYINYVKGTDNELSKNDIVKGIQLAFANAGNDAVLTGMQIGSQMLGQLKRYQDLGVEIDYEKFIKNFREQFNAEEFDRELLADDNGVMNDLMKQVQTIKDERENAARADELQSAGNAGAEYIASLKAEDPEIRTSDSGLSYKIINKGEAPFVQDNSMIDVYYVGKLIDGTVFDQTQDTPAKFSPANVIPGFAEGLKMLGKGGKAVLYIPGELAYGPNGVPQAGIGPNATLIFEIEVADVTNPE